MTQEPQEQDLAFCPKAIYDPDTVKIIVSQDGKNEIFRVPHWVLRHWRACEDENPRRLPRLYKTFFDEGLVENCLTNWLMSYHEKSHVDLMREIYKDMSIDDFDVYIDGNTAQHGTWSPPEEQEAEGFLDIYNATKNKINEIKLNIFYSLIPKQKLKDAIIRLIESVETLVVEITQRTSLSVQDWVESNFDLIIERIASYVGLVQVPQGDGDEIAFCACGKCEVYVPEVESPESIELVILVAQLLIPILRKWFS